MKKYKFNELKTKAQIKAVVDYIEGWCESHNDSLTLAEATACCMDCNDIIFYTKEGKQIENK